jgi:hypothetical protein
MGSAGLWYNGFLQLQSPEFGVIFRCWRFACCSFDRFSIAAGILHGAWAIRCMISQGYYSTHPSTHIFPLPLGQRFRLTVHLWIFKGFTYYNLNDILELSSRCHKGKKTYLERLIMLVLEFGSFARRMFIRQPSNSTAFVCDCLRLPRRLEATC